MERISFPKTDMEQNALPRTSDDVPYNLERTTGRRTLDDVLYTLANMTNHPAKDTRLCSVQCQIEWTSFPRTPYYVMCKSKLTEWSTILACPSRMCFLNRGDTEGTNSSKILCPMFVYVLFYVNLCHDWFCGLWVICGLMTCVQGK